MNEHKDLNKSRKKAILRELSERLRTDPSYQTRNRIKLYFEEQKSQLGSRV